MGHEMPGSDRLVVTIQDHGQPMLVSVNGQLSLHGVPELRTVLEKLLSDRGHLLVDTTGLTVSWRPAVNVFPVALASVGGWPLARLVLFGASAATAAALRAAQVHMTVPVAEDLARATELLAGRPKRVSRRVPLPLEPMAARWARHAVRSACEDWAVQLVVEDAELVATELVVNAIEHARSTSVLNVTLSSVGLLIGVRDFDPHGRPEMKEPEAWETSGRGLVVVQALSQKWGVSTHDDGKTVWAVLATRETG